MRLEVKTIQEPLEYGEAPAIEATFAGIADSGRRLGDLAKSLGAEAKKLEAASALGHLAILRKARQSIEALAAEARDVFGVIESFDEGPVIRSVGSRRFLQEIVDAALAINFEAVRLSGLSILAFPNRLTVDEKGVKIGRKPVASIRPSALAAMLKADADRARTTPPGFIDALRDAYEQKCPSGSSPVPLSDVYELLTLMPEVRKGYPESDFVRDLSVIDALGPYTSKDGKRISFVASTTTRMGKGYRAVSPSGDEVTYGSIGFVDAL